MKNLSINPDPAKSKGLVFLEYVLLALCLSVIAIRTTFTEGFGAESIQQPINEGNTIYTLLVSALLIFAFIFWLVQSFAGGKLSYRFTGIEIGLGLFVVAAIIASLAASNKRAAVTESISRIAPILMAILLVQILDTPAKIKLTLAVIAALGIVAAYHCAEQLFTSNQMAIAQYENAPESMLVPLGIQPGSFQQMLFEHSLYSKDVRGFFTTGNSAGSFAMMAFFAALALVFGEYRDRKDGQLGRRRLIGCGIAAIAVLLGLLITKSKGAIAALMIVTVMLIIFLLFKNWLKAHKKGVFVICVILAFAALAAVICYGITHGELPGGNSMMVRWQYWQASVQMYADHWLKGVGPGNFVHFYTQYKPAEALETVSAPHNFLLNILTQYGLIGLIGFLAAVLVPLWRVIFGSVFHSPEPQTPKTNSRGAAITLLVVIAIAMLMIRPILLPADSIPVLAVMIYVAVILYVTPVFLFIIAFLLFAPGARINGKFSVDTTVAVLFCGVLGLLVHNLVDFAIFEPGVFTVFWAMVATLVAADGLGKNRGYIVLKTNFLSRTIVLAAGVVSAWAYLNYCYVPVAVSEYKIRLANELGSGGLIYEAHGLLDSAAEDDTLSSKALAINSRLYVEGFFATGSRQRESLLEARKCLLEAVERNGADFKNYERLTQIHTALSQTSQAEERGDWLKKALESGEKAVLLYPGSDRLRFDLAGIADRLGKSDYAIEQYKRTVEIEEAYREQFRRMYGEVEIFSRLGEEKYQFARKRIKELSD